MNSAYSSKAKIYLHLGAWGFLGSIWPERLKKPYVSPAPYFYFPHARPHFNQNFKIYPMNLSKAKLCPPLEAWGHILGFSPIWPKRVVKKP